jgi:hypothetical protein
MEAREWVLGAAVVIAILAGIGILYEYENRACARTCGTRESMVVRQYYGTTMCFCRAPGGKFELEKLP